MEWLAAAGMLTVLWLAAWLLWRERWGSVSQGGAETLTQREIDTLRERFLKDGKDCFAKVRFESNSGQVEFLWGRLVRWEGDAVWMAYANQPLTHAGRVDGLQLHSVDDLVDWVRQDEQGETREPSSTPPQAEQAGAQ